MAAKEVRDFIENGNIKNSVNYPAADLGVCTAAGRISVCCKSSAGVAEKLSAIIGETENVVKDTKGDWMYILADTKSAVTDEAIQSVAALEDVVKVRVIK